MAPLGAKAKALIATGRASTVSLKATPLYQGFHEGVYHAAVWHRNRKAFMRAAVRRGRK
jgi:hypothetical protein